MTRHRLAPGVYDVDGELHIVVPELLVELGMEVTPKNVENMTDLLARQAGEMLPVGIPVDVVEEPLPIEPDPACWSCDDAGCSDCRPPFEGSEWS